MIVIAGSAKSGKTSALVAACAADPYGWFVRASGDTPESVSFRWPQLRLYIPGYSFGTLYIDEPEDIESWVRCTERIAAITVRIKKQVQP